MRCSGYQALVLISQRDWDIVCDRLQLAFEHEREIDGWHRSAETLACYSNPHVSRSLQNVIAMIEELVSIPWFRRI
jgi:hypothetical protein